MNVALIWSLPASFEESVLTAKTKIRLLPPLNISDKELEKAMDIITEVIEE